MDALAMVGTWKHFRNSSKSESLWFAHCVPMKTRKIVHTAAIEDTSPPKAYGPMSRPETDKTAQLSM
eukprot:6484096-Amphidinium_carterae.2